MKGEGVSRPHVSAKSGKKVQILHGQDSRKGLLASTSPIILALESRPLKGIFDHQKHITLGAFHT